MRRLCICLVMVPSLLVAASPVHASQGAGHRPQARAGVARSHAPAHVRVTRSPVIHQKYTWGRP